ncbi:sensor histidine kinase [Ornithinimicrobium avium]|nr:sensor histidine kinase [Ornithinimicrobium avium]
MTRARWALDLALAALLAVLGLVEVWLPLESVMGEGSAVVSTVGIVAFAALMTQRRARPWLALASLLVWPVLGIAQGGQMQVLFFGQLVPVMVLVYSLARHGQGRLRWVAPLAGILFVSTADLYIPLLQEPSELIFHWAGVILSFLTGHSLRLAEDRAVREAVRAQEARVSARQRAMVAVAEERARIARELHDIVAHSVGMIVVQAGAAEQVVEEDPEFARRALGTIRTTGSSALAEMRRLVGMLRAPDAEVDFAPQPGIAALPDLVASSGESGLEVSLTTRGEGRRLPRGVELTAYRVVQEALTNVRLHSAATRAEVVVDVGGDALEVQIRDEGPALPSEEPPGHGLVGMRERVALYGGTVTSEPTESGFTVRAVLPLEQV